MYQEYALDEKKDLIIEKLEELRDGYVDSKDLVSLLGGAWDELLSDTAKFFMPKEEFVAVCLTQKNDFLVALNGEYNAAGLYLIK